MTTYVVCRRFALLVAFSLVILACSKSEKKPGTSRDIDRDGVPNVTDNCPGLFNRRQLDLDGDGLGIACDATYDGEPIGHAAWAAKRFEMRCAWYEPGVNPGRTGCGAIRTR